MMRSATDAIILSVRVDMREELAHQLISQRRDPVPSLKPLAGGSCEIACDALSAWAPSKVLRDNARDNSLTPCGAP